MDMLCDVVHVMDVDNSFIVGLHQVFREQDAPADILADFPRHIVPEGAVDHRILVGVLLLRLFVVPLNERKDPAVSRIGSALHFPAQTVFTVMPHVLRMPRGRESVDHHVLNLFNMDRPVQILTAFLYCLGQHGDIRPGEAVFAAGLAQIRIRRGNGGPYFISVERNFPSVPLDYFQLCSSISFVASTRCPAQLLPVNFCSCSSRRQYIYACSSSVRPMI